jgi:hypothetical protein
MAALSSLLEIKWATPFSEKHWLKRVATSPVHLQNVSLNLTGSYDSRSLDVVPT